ncbi:ABC transporter ATP-binding protein [Pseudorhodobacter turbinis]|uniref:ABC transporter ATP-binding protein n=1 Tax=Pseudorhodobacter turbinis TaxID=2500533 RepID=A0A4P8EG07_9RHOB|nr:ABC transporter ATP-binding protein [Pseudorhodobacter turbinis]QCO55757.1 ABC transporter ATP-binding protein [Pseudorhodobacter turbinis]
MIRPNTDELQTKAVAVDYGATRIVEDLDLKIAPGRLTVLLGPNGSGKSTILRALARLQPVASGTVLLDAQAITRMSTKEFARRVGLLAQGAMAPDGLRVIDLVRQGRYPHRPLFGGWTADDDAAVAEALALTSLQKLQDRPLDVLSGGQRQRAWIAMTLAQATPILLLDEPTTYLDIAHQVDLMNLIRRLVDARAMTVVAVLHDLNQAARYADHLIMLKSGKVMAKGPAKDIITPEVIARAFGIEVKVFQDPDSGLPFCLPQRTLSDPADA